MSQTYFTILTNLGATLLAQATAQQTQLLLTQMAVGDGSGSVPSPMPTQTNLVNEVRRAAINSISIDKDNQNYIVIEQVIPPEEGGFYIRELGVFDDKGNLIAVGNCPPSYKPILSEGSGRTQVINMVIMIENDGTVELKIDAATVLATRKYVDNTLTEKIKSHEDSTNHPDATTKSKGFVQLDSAVDSDAEDKAATPKAVNEVNNTAKAAKKTADAALPTKTDDNGKKYVDEDIDFQKEITQKGNKFVTENKSFAINQTLQDVSSNRTSGVIFTNSTDKLIFVIVSAGTARDAGIRAYVDEKEIMFGNNLFSEVSCSYSSLFPVPPGSTYRVNFTAYQSTAPIYKWFELR